MGITIHYKGKLNDANLIEPFCNEMEDIAKDMGWKYKLLENDLYKPNSAQIIDGKIIGHIPLSGITLSIHKETESLSFYFDKNGNIQNIISMFFLSENELNDSSDFIKTQSAPIQIHISIIKLMKYIKSKYISNLEVTDEGEYWETQNEILLQEKFNYLNDKINEVGNLLSNIGSNSDDSVESMVDRIETILKNYFK
ncbi:MAG: hypothetical protein L3J41_04250 [Melioribacteraceae bacterium]|nr:hypothetical protein [Melioribacteraceae bacterium]